MEKNSGSTRKETDPKSKSSGLLPSSSSSSSNNNNNNTSRRFNSSADILDVDLGGDRHDSIVSDASKMASLMLKKSLNDKRDAGNRLNVLFFKRLWKIVGIFSPQGVCSPLVWLFCVLLGCSLFREVMKLQSGILASRFYSVLPQKDSGEFWNLIAYAFTIVIVTAFSLSVTLFVSQIMAVRSRGLITYRLHKMYFSRRTFYKMDVLDGRVDNPDQRITADVNGFTSQFFNLMQKIILLPLVIAYYTVLCEDSMGYLGPVTIYGFFVVSVVVNKLLMSPLVSLVYRQEEKEGNFRYHHVKVRTEAESIAFYHGSLNEHYNLTLKLEDVLGVQNSIVIRSFILSMSTNFFDYVGSILSYCIIAIPLFAGKYDSYSSTEISSLISANSFYSMYLINCFTQLIDTSKDVTELAGYTHRIGRFLEVAEQLCKEGEDMRNPNAELNEIEAKASPPGSPTIDSSANSSDVGSETNGAQLLKMTDVTITSPKHEVLLCANLSLTVTSGNNVLIMGPSGCGKSSIYRVLDNLWSLPSGTIEKPFTIGGPTGSFFVPQKPRLIDACLLANVMYPKIYKPNFVFVTDSGYRARISSYDDSAEHAASTDSLLTSRSLNRLDDDDDCEELQMDTTGDYGALNGENHGLVQSGMKALKLAGLEEVVERVGGCKAYSPDYEWSRVLSPGEQQRVMFARLFFHRPRLAFLDEATGSLNSEAEAYLYGICKKLNITVVSIGHSDSLKQYHDTLLKFGKNGSWNLSPI